MLLNLIKNSMEAIDDLRGSEDLIRKSFPLFSVDLDLQDDPGDGTVPASLFQHFRPNGLPLSSDARISIQDPGVKWQINDRGQVYTIRKEEDKLNVYAYFIKVKCYTESESLVLEVSDNGIGLDESMLEIVFRSGYTTKKSGTGLGLHSIAIFVKGCNGQIQALSDGIGKGATMRVVLPLA